MSACIETMQAYFGSMPACIGRRTSRRLAEVEVPGELLDRLGIGGGPLEVEGVGRLARIGVGSEPDAEAEAVVLGTVDGDESDKALGAVVVAAMCLSIGLIVSAAIHG